MMTTLLEAAPALTPKGGDSLMSHDMQNYIGYGAIVMMLLLFVIAMLVLVRAVKAMTVVILRLQGYSKEQIAAEMQPVKKEKKKQQNAGQRKSRSEGMKKNAGPKNC